MCVMTAWELRPARTQTESSPGLHNPALPQLLIAYCIKMHEQATKKGIRCTQRAQHPLNKEYTLNDIQDPFSDLR